MIAVGDSQIVGCGNEVSASSCCVSLHGLLSMESALMMRQEGSSARRVRGDQCRHLSMAMAVLRCRWAADLQIYENCDFPLISAPCPVAHRVDADCPLCLS